MCGFAHTNVLRTKDSEYLLCNREILRAILLIWHNQWVCKQIKNLEYLKIYKNNVKGQNYNHKYIDTYI